MAFDTTGPDRWATEAFVDYYDHVHTLTYGIRSMEVTQGSKGFRSPKGKLKQLMLKFEEAGYKDNKEQVTKEYIDWLFSAKGKKYTIGLNFMMTDGLISEFLVIKKKRDRKGGKKRASSKWG